MLLSRGVGQYKRQHKILDVKDKSWVDFTHFFVLLFSEEPLHTAKLGDQPIKTTESLIFNGQN
jgi:hypothetical protein